MANKNNVSRKDFIHVIGEKANANKDLLTYGALGQKMGIKVRDDSGLMHTFSNIYEIANNQYDNNGAHDWVAGGINSNFSASGYSDVSSVTTMGAIDVTIRILAKSLVPHVAVDRALADPKATVYYMNLVATNNVNGVKAGDTVVDNFAPIEAPSLFSQTVKSVATGPELTSDGVVLNLSTLIVPGKVHVRLIKDGDPAKNWEEAASGKEGTYSVIHGFDYKSDGVIVIGGAEVTGSISYKGTDGTAGQVTLKGDLTKWDTVVVEAEEDCTSITDANTDGDAQLTIKPVWESITLETRPKIINLQQNIHANAVIQKIQARAALLGATANYTALAFNRITSVYMEDVNQDCIKHIVKMAHSDVNKDVKVEFLDLSQYKNNKLVARNETLEHLVLRFFVNMTADFLQRTGLQPTVAICGTRGACELMTNLSKFVPSETFNTQQNGFAGTYNGIPVFRHILIDRLEERQFSEAAGFRKGTAQNVATFYLATKQLDNNCGSLVLGEFLPLTQLSTTSNFANLTQVASGFFSQIGITPIQEKLVKKGLISYTEDIQIGM